MVASPTAFAVVTLAAFGRIVYQDCDAGVEEGTMKAWYCQAAGFSTYVHMGPSSGGDSEHSGARPNVSARDSPASAPNGTPTEGSPTQPSSDSRDYQESSLWD